jgi:flagellar biosynthesis protein FlhB
MAATFPPTENQLKKLRQMKIVPISGDVTTFVILFALLSVLFAGQTELYFRLSSALFEPVIADFFKILLGVITLFLAPLICLVAVGTLIQTKGLCCFSQKHEIVNRENKLGERVFKFLAGVIKSSGLIYVLYVYTLSYFNNFQEWDKLYKDFVLTDNALILPTLDLILSFKDLILSICAICFFYALVCALISTAFVQVYFRCKYQMTHEEVQAEIQEQQMRPEVKAQLNK